MKLTKILSLLLVFVMLLSAVACDMFGTKPEDSEPETTTPEETPSQSETEGETTENVTEGCETTEATEETTTEATTEPEEPEAAFTLGMYQGNVGKTYYLAGGMNGYYMETTDNVASALPVYLEETTGGYYLYCYVSGAKTYINMVVNGEHVNGAYEATASTIYTIDDRNALISTVNDTVYQFGTRSDKTYTTVGPVAVSYNGFYCVLEATTATPPQPEETTTEGNTEVIEPGSVVTIAQALELCGQPGNVTTDRYLIRATIKSISNSQYGSMVITDATGEIAVYGTYGGENGEIYFNNLDPMPNKGDEVLLSCILQNYNGTKEVKNAWLVELVPGENTVDLTQYKKATIAEARDAEAGTKVIVSGTVAGITYANGKKPSGVILVNGADSIYVYSNDLAGRVKVGSRVEVAASKTYWILEDEQYSAAAHGYKGCNQLEDVTVISVTDGADDWVNSAIPTTTIKEIMDNPVSNDITTQIYKATALVKKVPGSSFVNYYLNDLDETTGSYVYTQCNGSDFAWVDAFDGKICTVYFVVINAKSTTSGCVYRFLPVKIVDENYTFNTEGAAEFAAKYHGATQFAASYTGNPALELKTSVSSELLGFENATLSYVSSDESVIKVETVEGKTVMNCLKTGTATITVTGSYGGKTYNSTVTITVDIPTEEIPSISISEAIAAENGTEVTVKGIVGPSVANKNGGFYLITEDGVISVLTTTETIATLSLGDEIIIKGTKKLSKDTDGQIVIDSAELLQNNYGSHKYSTASFITGKTVAEVIALDGDASHTTEVYIVSGTIYREGENYSTKYFVKNGDNKFLLYSGNKIQYAWLDDYIGADLTIELAVCDWNNKGNKGCVLSITTADGTKIVNEYNFTK